MAPMNVFAGQEIEMPTQEGRTTVGQIERVAGKYICISMWKIDGQGEPAV